MDIAAYLERIAHRGPTDPTAAVLRELVVAHRLAVPYESLDICPLRRPIVLRDAALYDKIVVRRRGGFCHELTQLFHWLLRALGFRTTLLGTEATFFPDGRVHPPLSHQLLLVEAGRRWLVDVAFGGRSPRWPLRLDDAGEQADGLTRYRVERGDEGSWTLVGFHFGAW